MLVLQNLKETKKSDDKKDAAEHNHSDCSLKNNRNVYEIKNEISNVKK